MDREEIRKLLSERANLFSGIRDYELEIVKRIAVSYTHLTLPTNREV